jgi:hypothetical protein
MHLAAGKDFLNWPVKRRANVLYIDGEMGIRLMKQRVIDASRRAGNVEPENLIVVSTEDLDSFQPLNTPGGQAYVDLLITACEENGIKLDLVIFDNIQALIPGDMKDEESWRQVLPWARTLTKRSIAQIWFHHTGHDESHSYGTKTREWEMESVMLMKRVPVDTGVDLAFGIEFTKARNRGPENFTQFAPMTLMLQNDQWDAVGLAKGGTSAKLENLTGRPKEALSVLRRLIQSAGQHAPPDAPDTAGDLGTSLATWREEYYRTMPDMKPDTRLKAFQRAAEKLQESEIIGIFDDFVWCR